MNIERYLLRRVLFVRNVHDLSELFKDIEEALAKPEPVAKREPLSEDEIETLLEPITGWYIDISQYDIDITRAIERAHGIGE
jgi:hypothetical protein